MSGVDVQIAIELRGFGWLEWMLRAQNFYEVIVNEDEARVNYRFIEIESFQKMKNKHCFFDKNLALSCYLLLLDIYWQIDSE